MKDSSEPLVFFTGPPQFIPSYATSSAAGADLKANLSTAMRLEPGDRALIPTGIHMAIPPGWEGQVRPRSGLAIKHGVTLLNHPGTIDADYRGEVKVILINLGREAVTISPGERIAQLIIAKVATAQFQWTEHLPETTRGVGGFGSTGL